MTDEGQLDPEIAAMLRRQVGEVSAPDGAAGKLFARLAVSIPDLGNPPSPDGAGDGGGAPGNPMPSGAAAAKSAVGAKLGPLVLTFLLGGGAGALATRGLTQPAPQAAPSVVYVDRPSPSAAPAASVVPTISVEALPSTTATAAGESQGVRPGPVGGDTVAERQLLDVARTMLMRGDRDAGLQALAEHARRYPSGRLEEEREALAIRTLAEGSRMAEARARATRFRQRWPRSMLLPAVEAALEP